MVILRLSDGIDRALDANRTSISPCGKRVVVTYGNIAPATGIEYFEITAGRLVSVLTVAETALYRIVDAWTDYDYKYLYVLDILTPNPATTVRLRLFSLSLPSSTPLATVSYTDAAPIDDLGFTYSPNARGGDVSCDGKYAIFSYITTLTSGGPPTTVPSTTTVLVVDALTLATVATFTFEGRTNVTRFCKVSCEGKKACTYIVFNSVSDVGSTSPNPVYSAPCYLNIYKLSVSGATATLVRRKKLPQYVRDIAIAQPLKRGVPARIVVGCRNTIKNLTAPTNLVTVTNNLVLSTSQCDTSELRVYLLTPKKCKLVSTYKTQDNVFGVTIDSKGQWIHTAETYGVFGDCNLVQYALTDNWKLQETSHAPIAQIPAIDGCDKYVMTAGLDDDTTTMSLQLFRIKDSDGC